MGTFNFDINGLAQNSIVQNEAYPQEEGINRFFTPTEISGILKPAKAVIDIEKKSIQTATDELKVLSNQSSLIETKLNNDIQEHQQAISNFDKEILELDTNIEQLNQQMEILTDPQPMVSKPVMQKESKSNLGLWLILTGFVIDIISVVATWGVQREAFGVSEIVQRVLFVMGIFVISFIFHLLHRKTQSKAAMIAICVGLTMSVAVAVHVVLVTAITETMPMATELSLDLAEDSTAPIVDAACGNNILTMLKMKPGIAEFFVMLFSALIGSISMFVKFGSMGKKTIEQQSSALPLTQKDYVLPLLRSQLLGLEAKRRALMIQKEKEENEFGQRVSGYKERHEQVVSEVEEKEQSIEASQKVIQNIIESVLQNLAALRMSILTMKSMLDGSLKPSMKYALASEDNVKTYLEIN